VNDFERGRMLADRNRCFCCVSYTEFVQLKRLPAQPREAHTVSTSDNAPQTLYPLPYETTI